MESINEIQWIDRCVQFLHTLNLGAWIVDDKDTVKIFKTLVI